MKVLAIRPAHLLAGYASESWLPFYTDNVTFNLPLAVILA
jgi:hypothetical protein